MTHQPPLEDPFGCAFHGKAKTITGHVWWCETPNDDGTFRRVPLRPSNPQATKEPTGG